MRLTIASGLTSIAFIAACAASGGPGNSGTGDDGTGNSSGSEVTSSGGSGSEQQLGIDE